VTTATAAHRTPRRRGVGAGLSMLSMPPILANKAEELRKKMLKKAGGKICRSAEEPACAYESPT